MAVALSFVAQLMLAMLLSPVLPAGDPGTSLQGK